MYVILASTNLENRHREDAPLRVYERVRRRLQAPKSRSHGGMSAIRRDGKRGDGVQTEEWRKGWPVHSASRRGLKHPSWGLEQTGAEIGMSGKNCASTKHKASLTQPDQIELGGAEPRCNRPAVTWRSSS